MLLSPGHQHPICFYGVTKGEAGIFPKPALKIYFEAEVLAQVLLEKCPQVLRANNVVFDDIIQGSRYLTVHSTPFGFGLG